jgi:hypothetical protein
MAMTLEDFKRRTQDGRIFTVAFVKRTTGEERVMNCRTGVSKGTVGGSLGYDPEKKALLSVYDVQAQGFRMVNLADLLWLRMAGAEYVWDGGRKAFVERG